MTTADKNCQSCGMPLKYDPTGGGTEADGTKNAMYCSHCYVNGAFTCDNISASEMQTLVKGKLKDMGFPRPLRWLFTRGIPKLKRWQK